MCPDGQRAHPQSLGDLGVRRANSADYEKDLIPRGEQAAAKSARNLDLVFDDKAPQSLLDEFAAYRDV